MTTTTGVLLCFGLFSVCLALRGMSRVVLLLTLDRAVRSLLATSTTLQCSSVLGLLCTAVAARIFGLFLTSLSEAWAET
jgi:hypothetical protein